MKKLTYKASDGDWYEYTEDMSARTVDQLIADIESDDNYTSGQVVISEYKIVEVD